MRFNIEQLAFAPSPERADEAIEFLKAIGMEDWVDDTVTARGFVSSEELGAAVNVADLAFHYPAEGPREIEVLSYQAGRNWLGQNPGAERMGSFSPVISHIGMHVSEIQLDEWRKLMERHDIVVKQEVWTVSHTNPVIAGKRLYHYVIFGTRKLIGTDLKFIVRREVE